MPLPIKVFFLIQNHTKFEYLLCCYDYLQVKTSHGVCRKAKVPSLGFAETAEKVFETGPPALRKYANFAR